MKLLDNVNVSSVRCRSDDLQQFFDFEDSIGFCDDINGLMEALNIEYNPRDWRVFVDASQSSLKVALLNRGKRLPTIPIAYSTILRESHETMKLILNKIKYDEHKWDICGDFKVIGLILGLQTGWTKYPCFLCEWVSREFNKQFTDFAWPTRRVYDPNQSKKDARNAISPPLVPREKITMPALHLKLGIVKNFIKAMDKDGNGFKHLSDIFPKLSEQKINAGMLLW